MKYSMVTTKEILDFIDGQPDDRPVNLNENDSTDECGCVMVHYGKEVLGLEDFVCGFRRIGDFIDLEQLINKIVDFDGIRPKNYGELKKRILINGN